MLTPEQSEMVAGLYPYAMVMANRRSARFGDYGRAMREAYRDVAADELVRCAATHAGINGASYKSYAVRSIRLGLVNADRRRDRREWAALGLVDPSCPPSAELDEADAFEAIVRPLDARYRAVLTRMYRDGLTAGEVGREMGLGLSGVESIKRRALVILRARMASREAA